MSDVDLKEFCAAGEWRSYLEQPFSIGEFTYATNGHMALRVPRRADVGSVKNAPESIAGMFEKVEGKEAGARPLPNIPDVPMSVCRDCRGGGKVTSCRECGGEGELECDLGHDHECGDCDGRGFFPALGREDSAIRPCPKCYGGGRVPEHGWDTPVIFPEGVAISIRYARKIAKLPGIRVNSAETYGGPLPFWFDGGAGLLMPLRTADLPGAIHLSDQVAGVADASPETLGNQGSATSATPATAE